MDSLKKLQLESGFWKAKAQIMGGTARRLPTQMDNDFIGNQMWIPTLEEGVQYLADVGSDKELQRLVSIHMEALLDCPAWKDGRLPDALYGEEYDVDTMGIIN